jgi:hypothetical protein
MEQFMGKGTSEEFQSFEKRSKNLNCKRKKK